MASTHAKMEIGLLPAWQSWPNGDADPEIRDEDDEDYDDEEEDVEADDLASLGTVVDAGMDGVEERRRSVSRPEDEAEAAARSWSSFSWADNQPDQRARDNASAMSWPEEDLELESTDRVSFMLASVDRLLYDGGDKSDGDKTRNAYSAALVNECNIWSRSFPHLRLSGRLAAIHSETSASASASSSSSGSTTSRSSLTSAQSRSRIPRRPQSSLNTSASRRRAQPAENNIQEEEEDTEEVYAIDGISSYSSSLRSRLLSSLAQRIFAKVAQSEVAALAEAFNRRSASDKDRSGKVNGGRVPEQILRLQEASLSESIDEDHDLESDFYDESPISLPNLQALQISSNSPRTGSANPVKRRPNTSQVATPAAARSPLSLRVTHINRESSAGFRNGEKIDLSSPRPAKSRLQRTRSRSGSPPRRSGLGWSPPPLWLPPISSTSASSSSASSRATTASSWRRRSPSASTASHVAPPPAQIPKNTLSVTGRRLVALQNDQVAKTRAANNRSRGQQPHSVAVAAAKSK